jgi:non-canonical purine NTP pyrophosphatase (RdgB/HAM1 family)
MSPSIYFVTQNDYKFAKFQEASATSPFHFSRLSVATPEIQATSNRPVAEYSAKWAANEYHRPVICEDVGLYLHAYHGFPGPYLLHVEGWLKTTGFTRLLTNCKNRRAHWEYALAYCAPNSQPVSFTASCHGHLTTKAKGRGKTHYRPTS